MIVDVNNANNYDNDGSVKKNGKKKFTGAKQGEAAVFVPEKCSTSDHDIQEITVVEEIFAKQCIISIALLFFLQSSRFVTRRGRPLSPLRTQD